MFVFLSVEPLGNVNVACCVSRVVTLETDREAYSTRAMELIDNFREIER